MITPHPWFEVITPDQVAETWDGVFNAGNLYEALWDTVDSYQKIDREDNGPADVIGLNSVKDFWDWFNPEQQTKLNELATAMDAKLEEMVKGVK